jgi:hypothetical protein
MFQIGEVQHLKGPGFFASTKVMLVMLLQNTKTAAGLVNGMTGLAEEVIPGRETFKVYAELSSIICTLTLSVDPWLELDDQYILCTAPLLCVLVRLPVTTLCHSLDYTIHLFCCSYFPAQTEREIPSMLILPFNQHLDLAPLNLGFAITDYKCRGSTFTSL